jgi:hypothetical protein
MNVLLYTCTTSAILFVVGAAAGHFWAKCRKLDEQLKTALRDSALAHEVIYANFIGGPYGGEVLYVQLHQKNVTIPYEVVTTETLSKGGDGIQKAHYVRHVEYRHYANSGVALAPERK